MITLTREEAQQVLDALEGVKDMAWDSDTVTGRKLIETLRAKLSEPEPKPVAWRKLWEGETEYTYYWMNRYQGSEPLYTAPPQRDETSAKAAEWVGLTDEELLDLADMAYANDLELLQTLQAKLKEKNYDKR